MSFVNPRTDFVFYVGAGVPTQERFADLRADALIIGPGLPQLTEQQLGLLPSEVRQEFDVIVGSGNIGALFFQSPQDQSTCDHLGPTMQQSSSVKNGRCNFYEPFGRTNSWRVLDADGNVIPEAGETYHVAVWLQDNTSGKFGVAVGTWVENFVKQFSGYPAQPACARSNLGDFSEEHSTVDPNCFPVVQCNVTQVSDSCEPAEQPSEQPSEQNPDVSADAEPDCPGGATTLTDSNATYTMVCGGKRCPNAAGKWEDVNMKMHMGMAIRFSTHPDVDFVRGMIPHHNGAVDMCDVLLDELTCEGYGDLGALDGLVHFCNHIKREQESQVAGMEEWLRTKISSIEGDEAVAEGTCEVMARREGAAHDHEHEDDGHEGHGGHSMHEMSMGCGETGSYASRAYIQANMEMHSGMAVDLSCNHEVDFVRQMIPHHKGAIVMCDVLLDEKSWMEEEAAGEHDHDHDHDHEHRRMDGMAGPDAYLRELCANITRVQRAEVVFLERWLVARDHRVYAPCGLTAEGTCSTSGLAAFGHLSGGAPEMACEDTLPTSSFCHLPNGAVNDEFCSCEALVAAGVHSCEGPAQPVSDGSSQVLDMLLECQRLCGACGPRPPLFPQPCTACQAGASFPYWCDRGAALLASSLHSAHQDSAADCLWMPDGSDTWHGDYGGDAPECQCHLHGYSCADVGADESLAAREAPVLPVVVLLLSALAARVGWQ